jgi:hypothetical protein
MKKRARALQKKWLDGLITNFEYLIQLNNIAGRTCNDLMQYPVFPWILCDYESEELNLTDFRIFRNLARPMGALTRRRSFYYQQRFNETDMDMELWTMDGVRPHPFHYATHYSSSAVVVHYLMRMEPFTQCMFSLQSGRFDRPDRLFQNIRQTWLSASTLMTSDFKELIPEFFFLSEFLLNGNNLALGSRQTGEVIDNVELPTWAHNSAREFVRMHRRALESEYVSAHLHEWIDLIFGARQRGEAAIEAQNVFHFMTYVGNVELDSIEDQEKRKAAKDQILSFGQTPLQLFSEPHPPRRRMPDLQVLASEPFRGAFKVVKVRRVDYPIGFLWAPAEALERDDEWVVLGLKQALLPPFKKQQHRQYLAWGFLGGSLRLCSLASHRVKAV